MARSADPCVGVVGVVSLVVYALHGFDGVLKRDLGVYMYGAQRFLDGDPPYVGILNRAGPLAHALPAIGIWVGRRLGVGDVHAARAFYLVLSVACVCLVYVLARDLFGSRLAALVSAAAFLGFEGFLDMATYGPREKTPMVLFLLVALLAMRHRRWATTGVFAALATLTWQPVFLVLALTGGVAIGLLPYGRWRALLRVVVGGGATTAVVVAYYVAHRAVHTFFEGFLLINARYTQQRAVTSSVTWDLLQEGYGASLWLILLGLVALPVLSARAVRPARDTRDAVPVTLVALGAGWLAGVGWAAVAFNGYLDAFELLPFAAFGLGGLTAAGLRRARPRVGGSATAGIVLGLALVLTVFAAGTSVTTRSDTLLTQRAAVASVLRSAPPHATVVSIQAPEALVIAHKRNPTSVQMFTNGFGRYIDDTWPGGLEGYADWLRRTAPDLIVTQRGLAPEWLTPVLEQDYRRVGGGPTFVWWKRTTDARG